MAIGVASAWKGDAWGAATEVTDIAAVGDPPSECVGEHKNASFRGDDAAMGEMLGRRSTLADALLVMGLSRFILRVRFVKKRSGSGTIHTPLIGEAMQLAVGDAWGEGHTSIGLMGHEPTEPVGL